MLISPGLQTCSDALRGLDFDYSAPLGSSANHDIRPMKLVILRDVEVYCIVMYVIHTYSRLMHIVPKMFTFTTFHSGHVPSSAFKLRTYLSTGLDQAFSEVSSVSFRKCLIEATSGAAHLLYQSNDIWTI